MTGREIRHAWEASDAEIAYHETAQDVIQRHLEDAINDHAWEASDAEIAYHETAQDVIQKTAQDVIQRHLEDAINELQAAMLRADRTDREKQHLRAQADALNAARAFFRRASS